MNPLSTEDNLIYHYTSTDVLLSILSRKHEYSTEEQADKNKDYICFRATHAKFLNDPTEYELALSLLKPSLLKYENENPEKNGVSQKFSNVDESRLISLAPGEPFLLALSELSDNLSMWRAYGLNGSGVSIGLEKKMLTEYGNKANTSFICCLYNKEENISLLSNFWSTIYDKMPLYIENGKIEGNDFFKFIKILRHCFSIKAEAYKEEKEWRLCKNEAFKEDIKYRIKSGLIIPYIEHYFSKDIIRRIIIGPSADSELSKKSIQMALKTYGYDETNISVMISKVPYRSQ